MRLSLELESIRIFGDSSKDNLNSVANSFWEELFELDALEEIDIMEIFSLFFILLCTIF